MKLPTIYAIAAVALSVASVQSVQASNGLRLGVSVSAARGPEKPAVFEVSLENIGPDDFVLNVGFMVAGGKVMFPAAVRLLLDGPGPSSSKCELRYFNRQYGVIAGRVDDMAVPLPSGATYTVRLPADHLWCPDTSVRTAAQLPPGSYRVTARFEGRSALAVNLDMKGMAFQPFWTGTAESGTVPFDVPAAAAAQIGYVWNFEERHAKADLVAIAEPIATKDTGRRTVHPSLRPELPVIELETELKVLTTLKGQSEPVVRLKHYRIDMEEWRRRHGAEAGLVNAGSHLSFDAPKGRTPAYLVYLIAIDDGRFEPLSGHTFPTETVFRLTPATEPR